MLQRLKPGRVARSVQHRLRHAWQHLQAKLQITYRRVRLWWSLQRNIARIRKLRGSLRAGEKILGIILVEHVGDIVACEPVVRYLRSRHPHARLVWVVGTRYRELVEDHPDLNLVLPVTCLTEALMLGRRAAFDDVFNLHVNKRACRSFGTVVEKTSGATDITLDNYYDFGSLLEAFSRSAGLPALVDAPRFYIRSNANKIDGVLPTNPYLVLHATTNDRTRDWTVERWHELVSRIEKETVLSLVEVGLTSVIATPANRVLNLCGRLSLQELAHTIQRAAGFVGVDSGPAHLANALHRPAVILLGHYAGWKSYMPYTGFFREHAAETLLQWDGAVADIPVEACLHRVLAHWHETGLSHEASTMARRGQDSRA